MVFPRQFQALIKIENEIQNIHFNTQQLEFIPEIRNNLRYNFSHMV